MLGEFCREGESEENGGIIRSDMDASARTYMQEVSTESYGTRHRHRDTTG